MKNSPTPYFFVLAFILYTSHLFAQTAISGKVIDNNKQAIPYASVALFNPADSSLVTGNTTDADGKFNLKSKPGKYYLHIKFLSFVDKYISDIQVNNESIALGNIVLEENSLALSEVQITAEKKQMELMLDKRIFNVSKDLSNAGNNAAQILDNVPSVTVDVEGNVSLRGSENVRILIDGKPSGLVGISTTDALRQLQGNLIESVEVITNPSSRYDAEGEVGIINIVLKKERRDGINGGFEVVAGYPDNYGLSANLNFRKKWFNLFTSFGVNYRKTPGNGNELREFYGDSAFVYRSNREHERGGTGQNFRFGSDFFLNDYNTITAAGLYRYSVGDNVSKLSYFDYNNDDQLTQTVVRTDNERESKQNAEFSLNYRKTFEQKNKEWTVDFKYIESDDTEESNLFEVSDAVNVNDIQQQSSNTEDEKNLLFQTDFIQPIGTDGKFEVGLKSTLRDIENNFKVSQLNSSGVYESLEGFDNYFIYSENIHAAYAMAGNKTGRFSYQGGLRYEYSDIGTELVKSNEVSDRKYGNLFPSVHFSYELDSTNTLQLSYSKRLSRPRFRHLLPFFGFSDSRSLFSGNPELNPEFTNSFELGHLKYFSSGSILSSIYYRHRTGVIEWINTVDDEGFSRRFPVNLSEQNAYGLEFNLNLDVQKWLRFTSSFNFYRALTSGSFEGVNYSSDTYSWTTRSSAKFKVKQVLDAQLSFNYRGPVQTTQGRRLSMYSLDFGLSKEVLQGKGTLTFSARDLFNTRKRRSITEGIDFYTESNFQWRSRQFTVSLNYRLHKDTKPKQTKAENEQGGEF